jgi:hypothetical protein
MMDEQENDSTTNTNSADDERYSESSLSLN